MSKQRCSDPYEGNILTSRLGPIMSPTEILKAHTCLPSVPTSVGDIPIHVRLHFLLGLLDLHIPPLPERRLSETVSLMIRQGYRHRDPEAAETWALVGGQGSLRSPRPPPAFGACVAGIPGVGKTRACLNSLARISQFLTHERFPRLEGGLTQVAWQSVEVPPGGRATDLARALMEAWDATTGGTRFSKALGIDKIRYSMSALDEWRQVASSHFLGLLHLDEIQNLFKIQNLRQRASRMGASGSPELSIVEDRTLRWILQLTNTAHIPILVSGTPDGIQALTKRLGTLQRVNTFGYHEFTPIELLPQENQPGGPFMEGLGRYQYVKHPLKVDHDFVRLLIELTGGVQRIIMALWIAAHRVAFDRGTEELRPEDFVKASKTWLAPLIPVVAALRSGDPMKMARYHDLVQMDSAFWTAIWGKVAAD